MDAVTGQDGDVEFTFVSGNPALDLAATVGYRRDDPVDRLRGPADLERWIAASSELPEAVSVDQEAFETALELREAIYTLAYDRIQERPFDLSSRTTVNDAAATAPPTVVLNETDVSTSGDLPAALSHIARSAITALADPHARLKECGRAGCTRIYLDRSRGARRTWCGMDECGNRVKAAAYRARRRAAASAETI